MARRIEVDIVGDSRSLERAFSRSEKAAKQFNSTMTSQARSTARAAAAGFGVGVGAAGVTQFLRDSTEAASNLAEQTSKTNAVFRQNAGEIERWSKSSATSMGLASDQALQAASSFGALLQPVGLVGPAAAEQSERLTQLGADLASFYNTSVQDALDAIRSGLVGESEPLRNYGALLSETRVQAEALAETHKKTTGQLTDQDKVLARIELILKDTKVAAGDFGKTSEGMANQLRIFHAETRDLQAELGKGLIPGLLGAVKAFNGLAGAIEGVNSKLRDLHVGFLTKGIAAPGGLLDKLGLPHFGGGGPPPGKFVPGKPIYPGAPVYGPPAPAAAAALHLPQRVSGTVRLRTGPTVMQRNAWFDAMIGRELVSVQDIGTLKGQIARYGQIADQIQQRLAITKDITRRLTLEGQLADVLRSKKTTEGTLADAIKQRAQDSAAAAKLAQQAATESARGWLEFAIERADATKTLKDDLRAYRNYENWLKAIVKKEGLTLELAREIWRTRQQIHDLNKKNKDLDPLAGLVQVSSSRLAGILAAGTGLGVAGRGRLAQNVSGLEVTSYVQIDGREVGRAVTKDQARSSRRTSRQTSGYRG